MTEKNLIEKTLRLGPYEFTPTDPHMSFSDLVDAIDGVLQEDMDNDRSGILWKLFNFFDSEKRPLDYREFYAFLGSWTIEDKIYYEMVGDDLPEGV
jgi:hypothetical protein